MLIPCAASGLRSIGVVVAGIMAAMVASSACAAAESTAIATVYSEEGPAGTVKPGDSLSYQTTVFAGYKTLLQGWVEYNTSTCKLISTGSYKVPAKPKHGELSYATKTFPLFGGPCSGTKLPFNTYYYTWTDTNAKDTLDSFRLNWSTPDGQYSHDLSWKILRGPRIYFLSKDVTNTTQKVAIGDQIALYTLPTVTGQKQSWTVSGKPIGGYTASAASYAKGKVEPTNFTRSSTTFYWTDKGAHTVNYKVTLPNGKTGTAKATFDTLGPVNQAPKIVLGTPQVINNNDLSFGNITTAKSPGMRVSVTSAASPKPGKFLWAQLVDSDSFIYYIGSARKVCSFGAGLDNIFPYETGNTTNDSPGTGLHGNWTRASQANKFRMYLLWQSNMANSIPVPLGHAAWNWSGTANQNMTTHIWTLTASSKSAQAFAGNDYPLWTKVLNNGNRACK
ncbi:MAG TPA: hypothetical protein VG986_17305 [Pseudolabrys sp.]|nr:hypothetical protein [Pseudolabrys sp.]